MRKKIIDFTRFTFQLIDTGGHIGHVCLGTGSMAPHFIFFAFLMVGQIFEIGLIFCKILHLNVNDAIKME